MQGNSPWYTPPSSALSNEPNNANYFYNYNQQWSRPPGNYDYRFYQNQQPMNSMRTCGESFGESNQSTSHSSYENSSMFFRQPTDYDASSHGRNRNERQRSNSNATESISQPNSDKLRNVKLNARTNDSEAENFSSVFTQSLTSLYSQDVDGNFVEEKQFSDDRNVNVVSCAKIKTEDTSNDCNNEYGFNPVFEGQSQNSVVNFQNVKIKTEPYARDSMPQYENYSLDDMYVRRRRGTLAEAYSRKRKHSVPAGAYGASVGMGTNEEKPQRMFQSDSQWIPNSIGNCEEASSNTYQRTEFAENYPGYEKSRFNKRHPVKSRVTRNRTENSDSKPVSSCKKAPKKISPLTVYVKVIDDRILDVTCRRYKKRSKPKNNPDVGSEDVGGSQGLTINQVMYCNKSWKDIFDVVGTMLRNLVDQVSKKLEAPVSIPLDLTDLNPFKAKELLYRFCHDYSMDYRDFTNVEEIIKSDVTSNKEEAPSRKRKGDRIGKNVEYTRKKRRGRSSDKEESVERKTEKAVEKSTTDSKPESTKAKTTEKPKPKVKTVRNSKQLDCESPQPRVLRSLPSRQPRQISRKTRSSKKFLLKNRYPKRNLRSRKQNVKLGKKLKILIDLSKENDQAEVLEVESDTSSHANSNESVLKSKSDVESDSTSKTVKDIASTESAEDEIRKTDVLYHDVNDDDESARFPNENCDISITINEDVPKDSADKITESVDECCVDDDDDDDDEDFGLRQPPQLVRMTDDSSMFQEDNDDKNITMCKNESVRSLSPSYLEEKKLGSRGDNAPPPTLQPNENFSGRFPYEESSNEFVIEKEIQVQPDVVDECILPDRDLSTVKIDECKADNEPSIHEIKSNNNNTSDLSQCESNSEDDCIVVDPEVSQLPTKDQIETKSSDSSDTPSLLKEKLLGASILDKLERGSSAEPKTLPLSPSMKSIAKDEQDESILRTLLLESEAVSNSGIVKEFESSGTSSPVIASIINSTGRDALSSLNIKSPEFGSNHLYSSKSGPPTDIVESLRMSKSSYQDPYMSRLSPETYEAAQKHFKDSSTPPIPPIIPKCETKETVIKDPQQLKEKIKKLKNEIVYLQLMAEQKEKEKIAIMCFKRYKEEILKRIYKAYAFSVQDHVRDWIFAKRENATENRCGSTSASNTTYKPSSPNQISDKSHTISESPKLTTSDSFKDAPYTLPAPAHSSSMIYRPQSIHPSQNTPPTTTTTCSSNSPSTNEKVSTVETMVAKATENYGLDMTNLRERLRCSPETSISGTILQKVLSSQSSSHTATHDATFGPRPWSPRSGEHTTRNRTPPGVTKAGPPIRPKVYQEQYGIPLDMMLSQTSRQSPNVESRATSKGPDVYRSSPETARPTHTAGQKPQTKPLLAEPVPIKAHRNPYRSWSIQAGGRIEDRSCYTKAVPNAAPPPVSASTVPNTGESPLQRQLNSNKGLPLHNIGLSAFSAKPGYNLNNHRSGMQNKLEKCSGSSEHTRSKKMIDEERHQMNYSPSVSNTASSSTVPYGGHIICNTSTFITSASTSKDGDTTTNTIRNHPTCMGCGLAIAKFLCSGCRKHWYCSTKCQSLRWPEHSNVCEGRRIFPQRPNTFS